MGNAAAVGSIVPQKHRINSSLQFTWFYVNIPTLKDSQDSNTEIN
jgi:hypothetical protein